MRALVGYTGFVGSNLFAGGVFEQFYHSKNVCDAFGTSPDLLVYAGVRGEKYLANLAPEKDKESIMQAKQNIEKIRPGNVVLISTIDVFKEPRMVDEKSVIDRTNLSAYGLHRYELECWVREKYQNALIIRLPALFGINIKKNFIYDVMNLIPFTLSPEKMKKLCSEIPDLIEDYRLRDDGFYEVKKRNHSQRALLRMKFEKIGFSALNFTDSRSRYQFYPLSRLAGDMDAALKAGITLWHPATEPISAGELYRYLTGKEFVNELAGVPAWYDVRTLYAEAFGGADGYLCKKDQILEQIKEFVTTYWMED